MLGVVLVCPTLHFWYLYLSKLVTLSGTSGALLRLVIDQVGPFCSSLDLDPSTLTFIFAPIFIGVFLSSLVTLEGRPSQAVPKLKQVFNDLTSLTDEELYDLRNRWATCFLGLFNPKVEYDDADEEA
ncbi:hypothetical protein TSUD_291510 [Trifolium subterraneum]|uniref:Uncharacterized protein n=1 Tax=Trifolium subterraneum TaxID=3900 RepID=A0A2Z6PLF4_TRISU|nr:hypothetical protein TSUD_291510 [Trifolium subterraneum]